MAYLNLLGVAREISEIKYIMLFVRIFSHIVYKNLLSSSKKKKKRDFSKHIFILIYDCERDI